MEGNMGEGGYLRNRNRNQRGGGLDVSSVVRKVIEAERDGLRINKIDTYRELSEDNISGWKSGCACCLVFPLVFSYILRFFIFSYPLSSRTCTHTLALTQACTSTRIHT